MRPTASMYDTFIPGKHVRNLPEKQLLAYIYQLLQYGVRYHRGQTATVNACHCIIDSISIQHTRYIRIVSIPTHDNIYKVTRRLLVNINSYKAYTKAAHRPVLLMRVTYTWYVYIYVRVSDNPHPWPSFGDGETLLILHKGPPTNP